MRRAAARGVMSAVEQLEAAGEVLSPAVRAVIVALETRVHELEVL